MSPSNTTIIFVPGSWHQPKVFQSVVSILEAAGYDTSLVELPSNGPTTHLLSFDADVAAIRHRIEAVLATNRKVVVVAHSYGGIPTSEALRDLPTTPTAVTASEAQGEGRGYVAHLFLCASFIIPAQSCLISAFGGPLPWFRISDDGLEVNPMGPAQVFYNDLPPDAAAAWAGMLQPQSYRVMHSAVTYEAWRHLPTTYQFCTRDAAIPLAIQEMMVRRTAAGVAGLREERTEAGHSPFLSRPEETATLIQKVAEM